MHDDDLFPTLGAGERLVYKVVNELEQSIIVGKLPAGTKLPPERDLAEKLEVSRTVVREAEHILVTKGLLETKHGIGTIVKDASTANIVESLSLMLRMHGISLDNLHQVRSILEVEIASLAASQASAADIQDLRRLLGELDAAASDAKAFADLDAEFHTAIAKTTHNPLLIVLLDSIRDLMQNVRISVSRYPLLYNTVMPDHYAIVDRIAARDERGARRAMQGHLEHARKIQELSLEPPENQKTKTERAVRGRAAPVRESPNR
ncbi:MAG: FadR family transcriptional regulator [Chloroflexi bacterium]|nr:FadR family transcriptional regulator [Chloroflexota bacterium]